MFALQLLRWWQMSQTEEKVTNKWEEKLEISQNMNGPIDERHSLGLKLGESRV